jgi:FkbM family methyltransferase
LASALREGLAKLARFLRIEYRKRTRPASVKLDGLVLTLDGAWASDAIREAIYGGWYEVDERAILQRTLRAGDRYLEIGGGIGFIASFACRIVGSKAVTVFEANPRLTDVIAETARRNGFTPTVVNAVMTDRSGESDFYLHEEFWKSSLVPSPGATRITTSARSFEEELAALDPTYLMVDVEGAETKLLSMPIPASVRTICVEVHPELTGDGATQAMITSLAQRGFVVDWRLSRSGVVLLRST